MRRPTARREPRPTRPHAARQKSGGPRDEAATPGFHQCVCDSTHFSGE
ncbi:hypothetical protein BMA721280_I0491 [Burkholderia mallei 2002721280]|uniref:Uncharacterized protein n=1 Tax=Burkholderia mallei (strain NCTC 10229) TaxID=412022 RepID=A2S1D8_BURM9|nr:hypothetical protein BMA10229_1961 [Burkholderia mallei NCTC 10229]EDK86313.1 hypothetical protein BMA721280_I0491 [Burkholderia mallei 2002721280]EDP86925.1 hypothetical protein BMA10399_B2041 [Burkholderia mallei ATCC 10399]EDS83332.1 hypothetical protein BURPSS13_X0347 [Burkholderia pseudomallei S13]